jgi:phosphoglycolate phosphatase
VWDFDGTLADTLGGLLETFNALAPRYGFLPVEDAHAARGMTARSLLTKHRVSLVKLPFLLRELFAAQRDRMATTPLCPGIADVLRSLHGAACRLAVLSSNAEENIRTCLRANGVDTFFETVEGYSRLFGKGRPLRRLVRRLGLPVHEAVYVGDEVRDVEAAHSAGVRVLAVTWGANDGPTLTAAGADHVVERPEELLSLLS